MQAAATSRLGHPATSRPVCGTLPEDIKSSFFKRYFRTSGQDGGAGRHTLPPGTTKGTTTNLKTKTDQNCQKMELYGSPTTKALKKKHSPRPVGGAETGCRAVRVGGWRTGWLHIRMRINQRNNWGARQTPQPRVPGGEMKPLNL